ncbi:glycosyltransferase involved in cell wall biosynthesis [Pseudorhizobium tarimense]|uniref:Glycosyltransferase involved in cell wall biosynthesis n=1 Tax=Pseudorhizobium tarimense TaxID=1079109 RepID=A0ABV2H4B2_9HYPH|nr:glycosyltransferase [Pseudorhizobium tarimense]MCJ8518614.1 glycosyltransferase [Pseudorhizobium tarimense]
MRVAIVHYWLVSMRGGERVVEALCDMYPDADIFTLVCDHEKISDKIRRHRIFTSFLQRIPGARRRYQSLLPLMPFALEGFDLSGYDLVLSSESGPAKGVIPPPQAVHVCYCHSPMRYIWDHYHLYRRNAGFLARLMMPLIAPLLRAWDAGSSLRVDRFVANSHHVASRIGKYYRRSCVVVHPPVAIEEFAPSAGFDDFYLCAGQIVPYKRVDLAVRTFTKLNRNLVVVGDGDNQDLGALKRIAGPTIRFTGPASFPELKDYLARCRALIFPGEEDFGIVPVEAMASGRPVIAFGKGGALDTIVPGHTGLLFKEQTVDSLADAIDLFETMEHSFHPELIQLHAAQFSIENFKAGMKRVIDQALSDRQTVVDVKPYAAHLSPVFEDLKHAPLH